MSPPLSLARLLQRHLERFYHLDPLPAIDDFVIVPSARRATHDSRQDTTGDARKDTGEDRTGEDIRETVLVRHHDNDVEIAVHLPEAALAPPGDITLDILGQVIEGVSHFVLLAERIRTALPTTQLELELQAEVDKFIVLGYLLNSASDSDPGGANVISLHRGLTLREGEREALGVLHHSLYGAVRFVHAEGTELGDRYRLANRLAAQLCFRLGPSKERARRAQDIPGQLRRFFRVGQLDKLRLAAA